MPSGVLVEKKTRKSKYTPCSVHNMTCIHLFLLARLTTNCLNKGAVCVRFVVYDYYNQL